MTWVTRSVLTGRLRRLTRCLVVCVAYGVLSGCGEEALAPLPVGAVRSAARPQYALWWAVAKSCSGFGGDLAGVEWYVVPGVSSFSSGSYDDLQGEWLPQHNRIVLAGSAVNDGMVVRHEMLHALSRDASHPASAFRDACGGLVACEGVCLETAGPLPDPPADATVISPQALALTVEIEPNPFSEEASDGWVVVTVSARNTSGGPVWVALDRPAGAAFASTFSFELGSAWGGSESTASDRLGFGAGQTRRSTFDLRLRPDGATVPAGSYALTGTFNSASTSPTPYVVP